MLRHAFASWLVVTSFISAAEDLPGPILRDAYFRAETKRLADASLAGIKTRADWEKARPEMYRQFLDMLGLWPLPERTPLKPVVTGTLDGGEFTVEKLHYQSLPGLYVTANLYLPKESKGPAPAVLYVCGHGAQIKDGVSHGNKVTYQHHGAWYAANGIVCLIVDTVQLGEIQGIHHGLHNKGMWWWQSLGYTPAGIECWNGMRAIDYLQSRKEVDPKRIGVAGRSGGGATSWWVGAADERVSAIVPVAGLADLWAHVVEGATPRFRDGVVSGHCDCMYIHNTYRWDYDAVIALCAPRALLLGNTDADAIFPVDGYRRPAAKARRIYDLLDAEDRFQLLEGKGPHMDTPELQRGEYAWMKRWLLGDKGEVELKSRPRFTPQQLRVFDALPSDAINATIHETFRKPASFDVPKEAEQAKTWWDAERSRLLAGLKDQVFRGWPTNPPALAVKEAEPIVKDGLKLRAFDFVSEDQVPLRLWLWTGAEVEKPSLVVLTAVDEPAWNEWLREIGPDFAGLVPMAASVPRDEKKLQQMARLLGRQKWGLATIAPRGIGPTRWADPSKPLDPHILRRFGLLGQTLDGQRVWDVRRGLNVLRQTPDLKEVPLWLQGKREMAGVVLYAGLFEPDVVRFDLWNLPASHRQGPTFMNVLRVLDLPQALALAAPKKVRLYVRDDEELKRWDWTANLQKQLGGDSLQIRKVPTP